MDRYRFWGKLRRTPVQVMIHPLVDHCLDVALVFRSLAEIPAFRRQFELADLPAAAACQLDRLAVLAFLHDVGKCNWGFQAKRDEHAAQVAGHVTEGAALLFDDDVRSLWPPSFEQLLLQACNWFAGSEEDLIGLLIAAMSHHGKPVSRGTVVMTGNVARWWRPHGGLDPMGALDEIAREVRRALPQAFGNTAAPLHITAGVQQRFAGMVMLADWIGSDTGFFPFRGSDAEDRAAFARLQSGAALRAIGLEGPRTHDRVPFEQVFRVQRASALQRAMDKDLPADAESRLVLIESETGSGKTEAALAWFLRLRAIGQVDSLYFALPTRVAAREIYARVCRAIDAAYPDAASRPGPVLLAAPGYVRIDGNPPILPDPEDFLWEDEAAERLKERQWAAAHPKRFLAAPVAVGTIDQALLSVLKVKHSLMRSVCLDRALLVVDEVHSSDPYMRALLEALLKGHLARGGRALLLSATLGEQANGQFFGRPPRPLEQAIARPYPCVTTQNQDRAVQASGRPKTVRVEFADSLDDQAVVPAIADALQRGARVLAVCNTVARANALLRAVEASGAVPASVVFAVNGVRCPHHGRFTREHREVMDREVSVRLGKGTLAGPVLLVGTQTLEQSLDIDADWLVTDLCPMDVMLQRIGRLHRHVREQRPPGFDTPRVLVRAPALRDLASRLRPDGTLAGLAGIGRVYPDGRIVQRTLDILSADPVIEIPGQNRRLVELATHPEALALLPEPWLRHARHVEGVELGKVHAALASTLDDLPFGELAYPAPEELVATRLGAGNVDLSLAHYLSHPFGITSRSVAIPGHMLPRGSVPPDRIDAVPFDGGFGFSVGSRRYRYTRFGLEIDDDA